MMVSGFCPVCDRDVYVEHEDAACPVCSSPLVGAAATPEEVDEAPATTG